jgi:ATP-binding cassette, subfamily B, bacterial
MKQTNSFPEMKTYRYMWQLIRYRPWLYALNAVLWTVIHVSPIIPGLIAQQFFNMLPEARQLNDALWLLIVLLITTALANVVLIFFGGLVDSLHRFTMSGLLRRNLLERILERPGARAVPGSPGEAISRFRDDAEQAEDAISWTLDNFGDLLFAIMAVVILLRINVLITLLVFFPLVGVVATVQFMSKRLRKYRLASREATGRVTSAIGEIFSSVQAIQIAAAEPYVIQNFQKLNEKRRVTMLRDQVLEQLLSSTFGNTVGIGTGLILMLAARSVASGQMRLGDLSLFIYYLGFVADFTQFFGTFLAHYAQTGVAFQRMKDLLQGAHPARLVAHRPLYLLSKPAPSLAAIAPARENHSQHLETLEACNLSYRYPDTGRGIEGVDIQLKRGMLTVITGQIGAGKTTLLQVLLGLLPRDSGEIHWNGMMVSDPATFFVPPRSAYTAQVPRLFSATLKENILLGISEEQGKIADVLHLSVMERDLQELEQGLETEIGTRGVKLSGGQAQRTAAARMFVRQADLLVFDDLSSALDVETEHILWERLFARRQHTCLVVSHRRAVLQRADHIVVLKEGKVAAAGKLDELLQTSAEMQRLWHGDVVD